MQSPVYRLAGCASARKVWLPTHQVISHWVCFVIGESLLNRCFVMSLFWRNPSRWWDQPITAVVWARWRYSSWPTASLKCNDLNSLPQQQICFEHYHKTSVRPGTQAPLPVQRRASELADGRGTSFLVWTANVTKHPPWRRISSHPR